MNHGERVPETEVPGPGTPGSAILLNLCLILTLMAMVSALIGGFFGYWAELLYSLEHVTGAGAQAGIVSGLLVGVLYSLGMVSVCKKHIARLVRRGFWYGIAAGLASGVTVHISLMIAWHEFWPIGIAVGAAIGMTVGMVLGSLAGRCLKALYGPDSYRKETTDAAA